MWLVLRILKFEVEQKGSFPVSLNFAPVVGYLPVYTTREEAQADFPDGPFYEIEIRLKEKP